MQFLVNMSVDYYIVYLFEINKDFGKSLRCAAFGVSEVNNINIYYKCLSCVIGFFLEMCFQILLWSILNSRTVDNNPVSKDILLSSRTKFSNLYI